MKKIPKSWYDFLLELSVNNNREWFEENKFLRTTSEVLFE